MKKYLFVLVVLFVIIASLECALRIYLKVNNVASGVWHLSDPNYIKVLDEVNDKEKHITSLKALTDNGFKYFDYHLFAAADIKTPTIEITNYFSSRATPASAPLDDSNRIVWMFGGSTLQNFGAPDDLALANIVAKQLNESGQKAHVKNFGVASFHSSLELIKFVDLLRRVPTAHRPTDVVFYDGFNDVYFSYHSGLGAINRDVSLKVSYLVEEKQSLVILNAISSGMAHYSKIWDVSAHRLIQKMLSPSMNVAYSKEFSDQIVVNYLQNVHMVDSICQSYKINCQFVLQPMLMTKSKLTAFENEILEDVSSELIKGYHHFYSSVGEKLKGFSKFSNLSNVFDNSLYSNFYDMGHLSPKSNLIVGYHVAKILKESP